MKYVLHLVNMAANSAPEYVYHTSHEPNSAPTPCSDLSTSFNRYYIWRIKPLRSEDVANDDSSSSDDGDVHVVHDGDDADYPQSLFAPAARFMPIVGWALAFANEKPLSQQRDINDARLWQPLQKLGWTTKDERVITLQEFQRLIGAKLTPNERKEIRMALDIIVSIVALQYPGVSVNSGSMSDMVQLMCMPKDMVLASINGDDELLNYLKNNLQTGIDFVGSL